MWRYEETKWSRQSEELPLHRVIDLATLIVSVLNDGDQDGVMNYPKGNANKVSVKADTEKEKYMLKRAHESFSKSLTKKKIFNSKVENT